MSEGYCKHCGKMFTQHLCGFGDDSPSVRCADGKTAYEHVSSAATGGTGSGPIAIDGKPIRTEYYPGDAASADVGLRSWLESIAKYATRDCDPEQSAMICGMVEQALNTQYVSPTVNIPGRDKEENSTLTDSNSEKSPISRSEMKRKNVMDGKPMDDGIRYAPGEQYIQELIAERAAYREALEKCKGQTYAWVIAEQTVNCKHTYGKIREIVDQALIQYEVGRK